MTEWLRPVFARARTSIGPVDRPASFSFDESAESEDGNTPRLRPSSRVPSYIGLRPSTPSVYEPDTFPNFRKPDNVYHKPSGDQMAEMLKVAVMSQSSFAPLSEAYNSCILHVLEAYQEMRVEIAKKDEEIEAMRHRHTTGIQDFEDMATQWEVKEKDYQAEIKKLEVLLSKTEGGMEKVALARSKSTVHGSRKIREAVKELAPIKQRHSERSLNKDIDQGTPTGAHNHDCPLYIQRENYPVTKNMRRRRKVAELPPYQAKSANEQSKVPIRSLEPNPQPSNGSLPTRASSPIKGTEDGPLDTQKLALTQAQLKALEREQSLRDFGVAFYSDESDSDSSEQSAGLELRASRRTSGLESDLQNPLPDVPSISRKLRRGASDQVDSPDASLKGPTAVPTQMGFSFKRGDDLSTLSQRSSGHHSKKLVEKDIRQSYSSASEKDSQILVTKETAAPLQRPQSVLAKPRPKQGPANMPTNPGQLDGGHGLHRFDSSSSVLTAFRAGSSRNSSDGSQRNSYSGPRRPAPDKSVGSSEAVTAAVRAVARSSATRSDEQRSPSSESVSGGQHKGGNRKNGSMDTGGHKQNGRSSLRGGESPSNGQESGQMATKNRTGLGIS